MSNSKTSDKPTFSCGSAFQVGGFTVNKSQFRLRTIGRGYYLEKTEKALGTGTGLLVREFKLVWNRKLHAPSFKLYTTAKVVAMAKEYMYDYFEDKCSGDYFPNVDENDTLGYEENLSCRKAAWFKMISGDKNTDLMTYLRKACIAIFSTEDREGEFYFEEQVIALVDKLLDPDYMKEDTNKEKLFEDFYDLEKNIDRTRKKKGASKRLLTKMCALATLILTETKIHGEETVDFLKDDKSPFTMKQIAKLAYNLYVNDIAAMTHFSCKAVLPSPIKVKDTEEENTDNID